MTSSKTMLTSKSRSRDQSHDHVTNVIKSKDVLYQVSSDLGEVNSFYSSFSDAGQKAPLHFKVRKSLLDIRLSFFHELANIFIVTVYITVQKILIFCVEFTKKLVLFSLFTPRFFIRKFINVAELFLRVRGYSLKRMYVEGVTRG